MRPIETVTGLTAHERRGAGTDAERRAAGWLAACLRADGREVVVETFWCRPNWAMAQAWHVALGLAGSLVAVRTPRIGGAMLLVALVSTVADALWAISLGRRLTPERASQNLVALPPSRARSARVALILTANYDAGRTGFVYRDGALRVLARLRPGLGAAAPGWLGWLAIWLVCLLAVAVARLEGAGGTLLGVTQLAPTVALVLALATLLDLASAGYGPAAGDNATGVAVAIELARQLDAEPPDGVAVHVVLTGAGDIGGLGLRAYLRGRRHSVQAHTAVVIGIAPSSAPLLRYWDSDGAFVPMRHFRELRRLGAQIAAEDPGLELGSLKGRGATPALPARLAGIPSLAIGCVDADGRSPRSHQRGDAVQEVDWDALSRTVALGLELTDAIDGFLRRGIAQGAIPLGVAHAKHL